MRRSDWRSIKMGRKRRMDGRKVGRKTTRIRTKLRTQPRYQQSSHEPDLLMNEVAPLMLGRNHVRKVIRSLLFDSNNCPKEKVYLSSSMEAIGSYAPENWEMSVTNCAGGNQYSVPVEMEAFAYLFGEELHRLPTITNKMTRVLVTMHRHPLNFAAGAGDLDVVRRLLAQADSTQSLFSMLERDTIMYEDGYMTPLQAAARNGHINVVYELLSAGADVNYRLNSRGTALYWACRYGRVDVVRLLLRRGASVQAHGSALPPLHVAALFGHLSVVKCILGNDQSTVDISMVSGCKEYTSFEGTAFDAAVERGHAAVAHELWNAGAECALSNTTIQRSVESGNLSTLQELGLFPAASYRTAYIVYELVHDANFIKELLEYDIDIDDVFSDYMFDGARDLLCRHAPLIVRAGGDLELVFEELNRDRFLKLWQGYAEGPAPCHLSSTPQAIDLF